jgi:hypothetical protein
MLRDTLDEDGTPLRCPRRQCRRSRHCSGAAYRPAAPLNPEERLPHCVLHAKPEVRQQFLAWAADLLPPLDDSTGPGAWPDDQEAANHLRLSLAIVERIHTRPGPHSDSERTALAAWAATDPAPETSATYRRLWRHTKVEKHRRKPSGAAVQPATQDAAAQAAPGAPT